MQCFTLHNWNVTAHHYSSLKLSVTSCVTLSNTYFNAGSFSITETELYILYSVQHTRVFQRAATFCSVSMPKPRRIEAAAATAAAAAAAPLRRVNAVCARDPVTSYRNEGRDGKRVVDGVAEQSPVRELDCLQANTHTHADERAAPIHALDTEERLGHHNRAHVQQLQLDLVNHWPTAARLLLLCVGHQRARFY